MANKIAEMLLSRDERAIDEAERRYGAYLRFLSESITHDARDAEECVNDAFLALWRAENVTSPAAFLTEAVRRLSYKRVRSEKTQKRSGEVRRLTAEERACEIPDRREPWDELEAGELRGVLSEFFDSLSPENKLIFVRRCLYSDSYAEIGGMLGVSENVVSVRLVRIRERLRRQLIEKGMINMDKFGRRGAIAGAAGVGATGSAGVGAADKAGGTERITYKGGGLGALYIQLPDDYSGLCDFSKQGLAGVNRADGKVGFIDEFGRVRIPFIYRMPENDDDAPSFGSEGLPHCG